MRPSNPPIDFMYVGGNIPPIPPPEGTPYIQDIAKVSVETITL